MQHTGLNNRFMYPLFSSEFSRKTKMSSAESMTDIEVQVEVQLTSNSPSRQSVFVGLQEDMSCEEETDCKESQNLRQGEVEEPPLLADVALALLCGDQAICTSHAVRQWEGSFQFVQLELQLLMNKADEFQDRLVNGKGHIEKNALAAEVSGFLYRCQPFFIHLESTARGKMFKLNHLTHNSFDINKRRMQMSDFSKQLTRKLEQLVLTYTSYNLLSVDETEPNSVSHFCIGQSLLGQLRLTTFHYCRPTPYLAHVNTGLYKCMRWNVDRARDEQQVIDKEQDGQSEDTEAETVSDTEYYFLCYEDMPITHEEADGDSQGDSRGSAVRMWSIGRWEQKIPDPDAEDIYHWIMCEVPRGKYRKLLSLGSNEPSSSSATDLLQKLLLSQQTTE